MAKFNWANPRSRKQNWAYDEGIVKELTHGTKRPRLKQGAWRHAHLMRTIALLTDRIRAGKSWLATVPRTDARYSKWSCALAALRLQRARLIAQGRQAKVRRK